MSIYLQDGSVVLDSGRVATGTDCCCTGVCCHCDGTCEGGTTQEHCEAAGGEWISDGGCSDDPPPCDSIATGACCNDSDCSIKTEKCCENDDGEYLGDDTECEPNPCVTGACCRGTACDVENQATCEGSGGVYQGDGTTCEPNPCAEGACCVGDVCSIGTREACALAGGIYVGDGTTCTPLPCPVPACPPCAFLGCDGQYYLTRITSASGNASIQIHGSDHATTYEFESVRIDTCNGDGSVSCACEGTGSAGTDGVQSIFFDAVCIGEIGWFTQAGSCKWSPLGGLEPGDALCPGCGIETCSGIVYECSCDTGSADCEYHSTATIDYSNPCIPV